jgi:hypothetical protein
MKFTRFNNLLKRCQLSKAGLTLFLIASMADTKAQQKSHSSKIHIGFIYPISSNGRHAPLDTNDISINLIAGISAEERGPAFAGVTNVVRKNTHGAQFAGFSNHIGKKANGVLFAGFTNTYQESKGAAFAGFGNIAHGSITGIQLAGFTNVAKTVNGIQLAGFLNIASSVKGSQLAGFMNISANISAFQFAGFLNRAKDVNGSQFAGFINVANKVKGIQFAGFINIAESSDYPMAILNFIKTGEKSTGLSIDENQTLLLSFRSGGRVLYGILAVGYNFQNKDEVYAMEAGFGAHLFKSTSFRLNTELTGSTLESFRDGEYFKASFKMFPAVKVVRQIEFFAGPSLNLITTNSIEGKALFKKSITKWQSSYSDYQQALTIGYNCGVHFIF